MFHNDNAIFSFVGPMGVRVEIGQSMGMLLAVIVLFASRGDMMSGIIFGAMLIAAIFLHELGHAWGCRVQGIPVRRIMLHGGGGFCEHARAMNGREQELVVAMGPLVNLGLWAICGIVQWAIFNNATAAYEQGFAPNPTALMINAYVGMFGFLNLAFFIFNMIPVQPLDGGKLFHLFLVRFLSAGAAHRTTGAVGLVLSIIWIPAAIFFYLEHGWILFFFPSIAAHYRMTKGQLA